MGRWRRVAGAVLATAAVAAACAPSGRDVTAIAPTTTAPTTPTTTPAAAGVGDTLYPDLGNTGYDVDHYDLTLAPDGATGVLTGAAVIDATAAMALTSFHLDFQGLTVDAVQVD